MKARHYKKLAKKTKVAPFPSYHEVKTFAREANLTGIRVENMAQPSSSGQIKNENAKIQLIETKTPEIIEVAAKDAVIKKAAVLKNKITNRNISLALPLAARRKYAPTNTLQHLFGVRHYSKDCNSPCDLVPKKPMPDCPKLTLKGCQRPSPTGCYCRRPVPPCRKQDAPYPSYSECMDPVYADDPTECTACPWPGEVSYDKVDRKKKRRFSTLARLSPVESNQDLQRYGFQLGGRSYCTQNNDPNYCENSRPPKQCKRPKQYRPSCDYKETGAKRSERRLRKFSSYKNKPPKKYRYSISTSNENRKGRESADVISKVRKWLNAWRPDNENIRVTARKISPEENVDANPSDKDVAKESYEIEIVEKSPNVAMASAVFHPRVTPQAEHGAPAGDLPAFVSEISSVNQGSERPVVEIREELLKPIPNTEVVECSGTASIPMECQRKSNAGSSGVCGTPPVRDPCKATHGGFIKEKKQPKEKPCRSPIKRPLPSCNPCCKYFNKIDTDVRPALSFKGDSNIPMRVNDIFNKIDNQEETNSNLYKRAPLDVSDYDHEFTQNGREQIDNAAQILNVNMPQEGNESTPPMKLKPQFWSKFTKITTLPIKD